jgi:hypothetical protein
VCCGVLIELWYGVRASELTMSVCRGCNCDVIICTWEGQNVGGLLRERERVMWGGGGGPGGWSDDWKGGGKRKHVKCYTMYDLGWYVGGRT